MSPVQEVVSPDAPQDARLGDAFHTVTQLARDLGITARTIRFYEDKGLISPQRAGSTRIYSVRDRGRMILILRGKRLGFSLREIKEYLDLYTADQTQAGQIRALLGGVHKRLDMLRDQRRALETTIGELEDIASQAKAALDAKMREKLASAG
jgi:DNA-binding transcriptional MerR regulator